MEDLYKEIKTRYGNVKRCRGFYLYTEKIRLLDMYLDGGMSVLGRRKTQADLVLKQFTDKGLCTFLPTSADYNLKKSLNLLFPNHKCIRFYFDFKKENKVLNLKNEDDFILNLWKPFSQSSYFLEEKEAFFVLPPRCSSVKIAVFKPQFEDIAPPSDYNFQAAEKAALAKAFFDLIKKIELEKKIGNLNDNAIINKTHDKKAKKLATSDLRAYNKVKELCTKVWDFDGIYLLPKIKKNSYDVFFKRALDSKILISPYFNIPSILPKIRVYTDLINFLRGF